MDETFKKKLAKKIVTAIWNDIYGRSGGDHFLDCAGDSDISKEMKKDLIDLVIEVLERAKP
jgi:hypothetical protein